MLLLNALSWSRWPFDHRNAPDDTHSLEEKKVPHRTNNSGGMRGLRANIADSCSNSVVWYVALIKYWGFGAIPMYVKEGGIVLKTRPYQVLVVLLVFLLRNLSGTLPHLGCLPCHLHGMVKL